MAKNDDKNPNGRPTVMTPGTIDKLMVAFALGCTDEEACAYAKISTTPMYDYQEDHPEFAEEKERLKQNPILKAKQTVVDSLGNVKDAQWYLERKKKDEFGLRHELTGKDGKPLVPNMPKTEEWLKKKLKRVQSNKK